MHVYGSYEAVSREISKEIEKNSFGWALYA